MKRSALQVMRHCGVFSVARAMSGRMARILMYHNFRGPEENENVAIDAKLLRKQFSWLDRHFQVLPLLELVARLQSGRGLGRNSVALTIDDGRRNFYEFAFPLLNFITCPFNALSAATFPLL